MNSYRRMRQNRFCRDKVMRTSVTLSTQSNTTKAINYMLNQWQALIYYCDDGVAEMDNNIAENALRGCCLGRKNFLFLGADSGGERAAAMYGLIGTARMNSIDPEAYLRYVFTHIADYPINRSPIFFLGMSPIA